MFPQCCPPKGPPPTSQAATRRCSKPCGSQTGAVLGTAAAPCTGTSRHAAGKGSGWPERACIAGFEITTCVSWSESLVPSPLHPSCSASQLGTLCTPRAAQTTSDPAKTPMWCPRRGLSCWLGSTPSCERGMLLVWPGAFLDLAVRLHEPFVFQAFFANENSFPPAKKLFIKKNKKFELSILIEDPCS